MFAQLPEQSEFPFKFTRKLFKTSKYKYFIVLKEKRNSEKIFKHMNIIRGNFKQL